jgi:hypothetical protein
MATRRHGGHGEKQEILRVLRASVVKRHPGLSCANMAGMARRETRDSPCSPCLGGQTTSWPFVCQHGRDGTERNKRFSVFSVSRWSNDILAFRVPTWQGWHGEKQEILRVLGASVVKRHLGLSCANMAGMARRETRDSPCSRCLGGQTTSWPFVCQHGREGTERNKRLSVFSVPRWSNDILAFRVPTWQGWHGEKQEILRVLRASVVKRHPGLSCANMASCAICSENSETATGSVSPLLPMMHHYGLNIKGTEQGKGGLGVLRSVMVIFFAKSHCAKARNAPPEACAGPRQRPCSSPAGRARPGGACTRCGPPCAPPSAPWPRRTPGR